MNQPMDKVLVGILSLGYLIASLILVGVSLGWTSPINYIENYLLYTTNRWVLGISGAVIFIISLTLFLSSFRSKPVKVTAIHETSLGRVNISMPALEHLVIKAAKSVQGIRDVKPFLKNNMADGLSVQLKIHVIPDINFPHVTEELQKKVKEYLFKTAGVNVHEIIVVVNKVTGEVKSRLE